MNMEWQPIETAPKDGAQFLGYWRTQYSSSYGVVVFDEFGEEWTCESVPVIDPMCWMELPPPPPGEKA